MSDHGSAPSTPAASAAASSTPKPSMAQAATQQQYGESKGLHKYGSIFIAVLFDILFALGIDVARRRYFPGQDEKKVKELIEKMQPHVNEGNYEEAVKILNESDLHASFPGLSWEDEEQLFEDDATLLSDPDKFNTDPNQTPLTKDKILEGIRFRAAHPGPVRNNFRRAHNTQKNEAKRIQKLAEFYRLTDDERLDWLKGEGLAEPRHIKKIKRTLAKLDRRIIKWNKKLKKTGKRLVKDIKQRKSRPTLGKALSVGNLLTLVASPGDDKP